MYVYLISIIAAVGGFLFGYDLSIVSGGVIFLRAQFHLSPLQVGFALSSATIGCVCGPIFGAPLADKIGRKKTLVFTAIVYGVGAIGSALPSNMTQFNAFRILGGVGVGLASVVSPMYIAEISPARIRGFLVTINQFAIVTGSLCSIIVGYFLSFSGNWRVMFASAIVPVICLLLGLMFVPESPRWLMEKGDAGRSREVLERVDGPAAAEREIQEITESLRQESGGLRELFHPGVKRALLIAVALAVYQQFTGVSPLLFYAPVIFQQAGFHKASDAMMQTVIVNVWNLFCTGLALWLVDRVGRRPLLLVGTAGMTFGQLLMGIFFALKLTGIYVVVTMMICVAFYVTSLAPLAWLIMSEIFPTRIRSTAMATASVFLWLSAFVAAQAFAPASAFFQRTMGSVAAVFWIFAAICLSSFIFSWRMVPETKGRSLEEIGRSWLARADAVEH